VFGDALLGSAIPYGVRRSIIGAGMGRKGRGKERGRRGKNRKGAKWSGAGSLAYFARLRSIKFDHEKHERHERTKDRSASWDSRRSGRVADRKISHFRSKN